MTSVVTAKAGPRPATHSARGATLFEFLILASLILIFVVVAILRIWELRIAAERNGVEHLVGTLKSALGIELVQTIVKQKKFGELARYHQSNPMRYLNSATLPSNYLGEFDTAPEGPMPGTWYFSREDSALTYRVRFTDYLKNSHPSDPELLQYQVRLNFIDGNQNGKYDPESEVANGIDIVSLHHYSWIVPR